MTPAEVLVRFPSLSALVIGDVCLDRWCSYDPALSEPSRETNIPRTAIVGTEVTPGAAGTVANNLVALGVGRVAVLGAIGQDGFGGELLDALQERRISADLCVRSSALQTFTYTKLLNIVTGIEDLPRIDFINATPLPGRVETEIIENLARAVPDYDVILVSDQAETAFGGVITPSVRDALSKLAFRHPEKIFFVDSRSRMELFRGLTLKANQEEAEAASIRLHRNINYQDLLQHTESPLLLVTHGGRGVLVVNGKEQHWVETRAIPNPVDICGAGDSFSAGAAMTLAVVRSPVEAARFGNRVASITIMKKGTGTASPDEILAQK